MDGSMPGTSQGIGVILEVCRENYPTNRDPLVVMSGTKYWMGGPDPLDYVAMFWNNGKENGVQVSPPHWHYISMGLSDLHGDGRVHPLPSHGRSGLGIEFTFRLKCGGLNEENPPTWPAVFLQQMARLWLAHDVRYGSKLPPAPGGTQLDTPFGIKASKDRPAIKSVIYCADTQLKPVDGPFGRVEFLQLVGTFEDELMRAEEWEPLKLIHIISTETQNKLLVTDFTRLQSISNSPAWRIVEEGKRSSGSSLCGTEGFVQWKPWCLNGSDRSNQDLNKPKPPESAENLAAISILMCENLLRYVKIMLEGRLSHGRRFTFCDSGTSDMITWVPESDSDRVVTAERPYLVCQKPNYKDVFICATRSVLECLRNVTSPGDQENRDAGFRIAIRARS